MRSTADAAVRGGRAYLCWLVVVGAGCGGAGRREPELEAAAKQQQAPAAQSAAPAAKAEPASAQPEPSSAAVPPPPTPVKPRIESFKVKLAGKNVELSWSAPQDAAFVRVVRAAAPLDSPDDPAAIPVYAGSASTAKHALAQLHADVAAAGEREPNTVHYAAFACRSAADCEPAPARAVLVDGLIAALRRGGYVFYFRHGTADVCQDVEPLGTADKTEQPGWWKSCDSDCATATARQLNAQGKAEAKQLGVEFARLKLPVARVVSSEFCRNVQSAKLMALRSRGKPLPIETAKELTSFVYDEKNRCANIYKMLGQPPPRGANVVLLGQKGNECPVVGTLDPAGAAIFKPDGKGGTQAVAVMKWQDWASY